MKTVLMALLWAPCLALAGMPAGSAGEADLEGYETACVLDVNKRVADVYIQQIGMFRREVSPGNFDTQIGIRVWNIDKFCLFGDKQADITVEIHSSTGAGYVRTTIHWDPRSHLMGDWAYKMFRGFYLRDCGSRVTYHVHTFCG